MTVVVIPHCTTVDDRSTTVDDRNRVQIGSGDDE